MSEKVVELEIGMLHFENSQAQMIFSATGDGVAMILLHPILQITSNIQRPAEEPSLANPSIAYRKEVTRSCRVTSVEEQVAEEGAAGEEEGQLHA